MSLSVMLQQLASGMVVSVEIFVVTLLFSLPLGLLICFGRMSKNPAIRGIVSAYISVMRGTCPTDARHCRGRRQPYCTSHGMDKMHPEGIHAHHHYQSSLRRVRKMKDERLKNGGMQFITHYTERYSYLDAARMALEGGCRWVQLRMDYEKVMDNLKTLKSQLDGIYKKSEDET